MKKCLLMSAVASFLLLGNGFAQLSKVNELCKEMPCESGLYCVTLKNGDQKCATCDQSTLNDLTGKVDEYCKGYDVGWTPEASSEFQEALASDGRVWIDVFDIMLEKAKKCKEAREYREDKCWNDGDDEHIKAINQVKESIERIAKHKQRQIDDRRVYYCSESTYESRLSSYNSKCGSLDFPNINQKMDIMINAMNGGGKIDCDDMEDYMEDCQECLDAANNLLYDGFRNSSSYIPEVYNKVMLSAQEAVKKAKNALEYAEDGSLCN